MISLNKPSRTAREVFKTCIGKIEDADLKGRLEKVENEVSSASTTFETAAGSQSAHEIEPHDSVAGIVNAKEMEKVYTQWMVGKKASGRPIYDSLIASAPQGHCPLCGLRDVKTLDHFLPKMQYPSLAVTPLNLVPCCSDCNKIKQSKVSRVAAEVSLNPYFDKVDGELWLKATVLESIPASIIFSVEVPTSWDTLLGKRLSYHFDLFNLNSLYGLHAAGELAGCRYYLKRLLNKGGPSYVSTYLDEIAVSNEHGRLNSWQAATYRAWNQSDWFCSGGFASTG